MDHHEKEELRRAARAQAQNAAMRQLRQEQAEDLALESMPDDPKRHIHLTVPSPGHAEDARRRSVQQAQARSRMTQA